MRKPISLLIRSGVWLGTATVLGACIVAARLLFAPIDIGFARDNIIDRAASFLPGWKIEFTEAEIGWDWRQVRPWLFISDLKLIDRADRLSAHVPELHVGVSFTSMLSGLSFSTIEMAGTQVLVTDLAGFSDATGGPGLAELFGTDGIPKPEVFIPITDAFSRFGVRLLDQAPRLDSISIQSTTLAIVRGEGFQPAQLAVPRFDIKQQDAGLQMDSLLDIQLGPTPTQVRLSGQALPEGGDLSVQLSFSQFRPADLAYQFDVPDFVNDFEIPLSLDLGLDMQAGVGLVAANFSVTLDEGRLTDPVKYPEPAPIRYGLVSGAYDPARNIVDIETLEVQAGDSLITGDGTLYWLEKFESPGVRATLSVDAASIEVIKRYWPIKTYPDGRHRGARAWIDQHMLAGQAVNGRFDVNWSPETGGAFDEGSPFKLTFGFDHIATRYLADMPPIQKASGRGVMTRKALDLYIESGEILGMPLGGSEAHLRDIHIKEETEGIFDIRLKGRMETVLDLVSYEPLRVPQKAKFEASRVGGDSVVRAVVTAPLQKNVPKEQIRYEVNARIEDAYVRDLLGGDGLSAGDLTLLVTNDNLAVEGAGRLNGVPLRLFWQEDLAQGRSDPAADTTEILLRGRVDEADIQALGVDVSSFLDGKVDAEAVFVGRDFKFSRGDFTAEAAEAALRIEELAYTKSPGAPAKIAGTLLFGESGYRLQPLTVVGDDIDLSLTLNWSEAEKGAFELDFTAQKVGRHRLAGLVTQDAAGVGTVRITAEQFDLGAYIRDLEINGGQDGKEKADVEPGITHLAIEADRLLLINGEAIEGAELTTKLVGGAPLTMDFKGQVAGTGHGISLSIEDTGDPAGNTLTLTSADAGHILRGLGIFSHIKGGSLQLEGLTSGWGRDLSISGEGKIRDSLMVAGDKLGADVTEGVLSGLSDFLDGGAVELNKIDFPFAFDGGLLDLKGMQANGPRLGMTLEGQLSVRSDQVNVNGVYVPAYGLNALLGKIPLFGTLLTGGEGKGVFGVAFRVKGPLKEPEFTVNPLSSIAPGFLRLLFEGSKGKVDAEAAPAPENNPPEKAPEGSEGPDGSGAGASLGSDTPAVDEKGSTAEPSNPD